MVGQPTVSECKPAWHEHVSILKYKGNNIRARLGLNGPCSLFLPSIYYVSIVLLLGHNNPELGYQHSFHFPIKSMRDIKISVSRST